MSEEADEVCAFCGIAAVDEIKMKDCDDGCGHIVKYCSDACQENHTEQHEEECKKRLAEIRDIDLFTQPDGSHLGECPICCLPMSIVSKESALMSCCSKRICRGCEYANKKREKEVGLEQRCAFCREPVPKSEKEFEKRCMKRGRRKNCPVALYHMGTKHYCEGNYQGAYEYFTKAAELGDEEAHYVLSVMYYQGQGVEKDKEKEVYHLEEAAIAGHPTARHNLGCIEFKNGRHEKAAKHFIIAANLGCQVSLKVLMKLYKEGHVSKNDYAGALRAHQAAVDATKSLQRDVAEAYYKPLDAAQGF
jgi:tetratricopeptide (TPR) repeat protein